MSSSLPQPKPASMRTAHLTLVGVSETHATQGCAIFFPEAPNLLRRFILISICLMRQKLVLSRLAAQTEEQVHGKRATMEVELLV